MKKEYSEKELKDKYKKYIKTINDVIEEHKRDSKNLEMLELHSKMSYEDWYEVNVEKSAIFYMKDGKLIKERMY